MTKQQTWDNTIQLLQANGIETNSPLYTGLRTLLAPQRANHEFEPIKDETGTITELYCTWFKEYRHVDQFTKVSKSKHGYSYDCKDAQAEANKYTKAIKDIQAEISNLINDILDDTITPAEAKEIKTAFEADIATLKANRELKIMFDNQD